MCRRVPAQRWIHSFVHRHTSIVCGMLRNVVPEKRALHSHNCQMPWFSHFMTLPNFRDSNYCVQRPLDCECYRNFCTLQGDWFRAQEQTETCLELVWSSLMPEDVEAMFERPTHKWTSCSIHWSSKPIIPHPHTHTCGHAIFGTFETQKRPRKKKLSTFNELIYFANGFRHSKTSKFTTTETYMQIHTYNTSYFLLYIEAKSIYLELCVSRS